MVGALIDTLTSGDTEFRTKLKAKFIERGKQQRMGCNGCIKEVQKFHNAL